jgi:hypothetical protein
MEIPWDSTTGMEVIGDELMLEIGVKLPMELMEVLPQDKEI